MWIGVEGNYELEYEQYVRVKSGCLPKSQMSLSVIAWYFLLKRRTEELREQVFMATPLLEQNKPDCVENHKVLFCIRWYTSESVSST